MKQLIFSDFHFHNYNNEFAEIKDGVSTRFLEQLDVLEQIFKIVLKENVDEVIFLGDLFHLRGKIDTLIFNEVYKRFLNFIEVNNHIRFYFVVGNHDFRDRNLEANSLELFKKNCVVVDNYFCDGNRLFIAYKPKGAEDKVKTLIHNYKPKVLYGHFYFEDCGLNDGFSKDILSESEEFVFLGHLHRTYTDKNVYYVGTPLQLTFNEEGYDCGCIIFDGNKVKRIKLKYKEFKTIKAKDYTDDLKEKYYLRVLVENEKDLKKFEGGKVKINLQVEDNEVNLSDVLKFDDEISILKSYFDYKKIENKEELVRLFNEVVKG